MKARKTNKMFLKGVYSLVKDEILFWESKNIEKIIMKKLSNKK